MALKEFQHRVAGEVEGFFRALAEEWGRGNREFGATAAWKRLGLGRYEPRENGLGEDLPTVCIRVPTGGGKTLLATQALGAIYRTVLRDRNGAGLALWVAPSSQIYRDTLRRLRDRNDLYRVMLEHATSRRLEVWEKHEVARLSPAKLRDCLNILVLQLASTNRETREQLKFFRDSGGAIVEHFPPENDGAAQRALKARVPNLDMVEEDERRGRHLCATSIGNLVRLCRPPVVLDEGHKATSDLARRTIEGFNACAVVELSATPHQGANVVSRVSGEELLREEMIKLPLNIATSGQKNWKDVLTQARDKRAALAKRAAAWSADAGPDRLIRPIVLVQVERTGKDQVEAGRVHSTHVVDYLTQRLGIPATAIAVKSAQDDGLEDVDLMDPGCPVEWIITKSALQEGWDCPFAYILVSLNNTGSGTAMTQLVGRVLRQPFTAKAPVEFGDLNESYVYCLHERPAELAKHIKKALEREGYEGDLDGAVTDRSRGGPEKRERTVRMRPEFREFYREFEGKVYVPRFCVKEGKAHRPLDYFEHLLRRVDVAAFEYGSIDWPLAEALAEAKDRFFKLSLGTDVTGYQETAADLIEDDARAMAWMAATVRFEFLSHKQLRAIIGRVYERLCGSELSGMVKARLSLVKFVVRERVERFIQEQVDVQTERAFRELFEAGKVVFYLECRECRFEIPPEVTVAIKGPQTPLAHPDDGSVVGKSLFDFAAREDQNEWERSIALCLDRDANVLWWYRNCVGEGNFAIQGYRRQRIYPDFLVQGGRGGKPLNWVLVLESKGEHLEGNPDTTYKRNVAGFYERAGKRVTWQELGEEFKDHLFRFQVLDEAQPHGRDWRDELSAMLAR
jgi:type III restriction enzyme